MARNKDPLGFLPSSKAVREALREARQRVSALEYLLTATEGVEARLNGSTSSPSESVSEATR